MPNPEPNESTEQLPALTGGGSIESLIARAIDRGVTVDTMERLLAMRTQLKAEAAREAFFDALANLQAALPSIPKTKRVDFGGGKAAYSYAPLEQIVRTVAPLIHAHGFSVTVEAAQEIEPPRVIAIATLHHRDGHQQSSRFCVPVDTAARMNAAQQVASALTYAKRYAYCDVLGIVTADEDDDGRASGRGAAGTSETLKLTPQQSRNDPPPSSKRGMHEREIIETLRRVFPNDEQAQLDELHDLSGFDNKEGKHFEIRDFAALSKVSEKWVNGVLAKLREKVAESEEPVDHAPEPGDDVEY